MPYPTDKMEWTFNSKLIACIKSIHHSFQHNLNGFLLQVTCQLLEEEKSDLRY